MEERKMPSKIEIRCVDCGRLVTVNINSIRCLPCGRANHHRRVNEQNRSRRRSGDGRRQYEGRPFWVWMELYLRDE